MSAIIKAIHGQVTKKDTNNNTSSHYQRTVAGMVVLNAVKPVAHRDLYHQLSEKDKEYYANYEAMLRYERQAGRRWADMADEEEEDMGKTPHDEDLRGEQRSAQREKKKSAKESTDASNSSNSDDSSDDSSDSDAESDDDDSTGKGAPDDLFYFDIKAAYLLTKTHEEIWIELPKGLEIHEGEKGK